MTAKATKNQPSHLKDLLLLFAIPVGIAIFAAAVIYTPRLFANPKHDFIYSFCDNYDCRGSYNVDASGHVSRVQVSDSNYPNNIATIRYYDANTDSTRSLTIEEAQRYKLNTSSKSPDGYSLSREETSTGFLFWGDYDDGWYLKNGAKKKKIELSSSSSSYYYSNQVKFLGWVSK